MGKYNVVNVVDNKENIFNILIKTAYIILLLFPFSIGTIYGLINCFADWTWLFDGHNKAFYSQPDFLYKKMAFLALAAMILIVAIIIKLFSSLYKAFADRGENIKGTIVTIVIIFAMTVMIRMILLYIYDGEMQPFLDFSRAWERANGDMSSLFRYSFFPSWMNYSLLEKLISYATGARYAAVLIFGIVCNGITNIFIFLITNEMFKKYELSLLASTLYLLNPSSIVYVLTSTPEHLAIACFTCSIYLICKYFDAKRSADKMIYLIVAGIFGGIGSSVKTFFPIILAALMIILMLSELRKSDEKKVRAFAIVCFSVMILFLVQKLTVNGITAMSEKVFDVELNFADATPHYLNVGLNRQGEGQVGVGNLSRLYLKDRLDGLSLEEAKANAIERVADDWKENMKEVPEFFVKKTIWAWQDDYIPIKYFLLKIEIKCDTFIEEAIYNIIATIGAAFSQLWYILLMFLGMLGVVFVLKKDIGNLKFMFSNLIILGYFCLIILSEAQSRYKCLILPFLCMIDAYAVLQIYEIVKVKWNKLRHSA